MKLASIYVALAFLFLIIGAIGVAIPILPTTPFLIAASFCFARGSERCNKWFMSTKIYKEHLGSYAESRTMSMKTKIRILVIVTLTLISAMYFSNNLYARIAIACVIVFKYCFILSIKTAEKNTYKSHGREILK